MKESQAEEVTAPEELKILADPYDIGKVFEDARSGKAGEPKRMVAWWDGHSLRLANSVEDLENLPPSVQIKTNVTASGVSHERVSIPAKPRVAIRCVAINAGDGYKLVNAVPVEGGNFKVVNGLEVEGDGSKVVSASYIEYLLRSEILKIEIGSLSPNLQPWSGPQAAVLNWIETERSKLDAVCAVLEKIDPKFAECKREHEARNDPLGWRADEDVPHTMEQAISARHALKKLEKLLTDLSWLNTGAKPLGGPYVQASNILRIAQCAFHAGLHAQELQSIAASYPTLSTLGAGKGSGKKQGKRNKFVQDVLAKLDQLHKGSAPTLTVMRELKGKIDPQTGKPIEYHNDPSTGEIYIRYADGSSMLPDSFAVLLARLRKNIQKKVISV